MFFGSIPALITPFSNGQVDDAAFQHLVEWQIAQGSSAVSPCGTTGESPTLSHAELERVVRLCVEAAAGRVPVIAGTGSNSTSEAISLTRSAEASGVDAALIVTPYYNKPTQEGLYLHYKAIHDAVALPIVIYNIPGRSVIDMSVETMARLAELPRIIGVKDATGDLARPNARGSLRMGLGIWRGRRGCVRRSGLISASSPATIRHCPAFWRRAAMVAFRWSPILPRPPAPRCTGRGGPAIWRSSRIGAIA